MKRLMMRDVMHAHNLALSKGWPMVPPRRQRRETRGQSGHPVPLHEVVGPTWNWQRCTGSGEPALDVHRRPTRKFLVGTCRVCGAVKGVRVTTGANSVLLDEPVMRPHKAKGGKP